MKVAELVEYGFHEALKDSIHSLCLARGSSRDLLNSNLLSELNLKEQLERIRPLLVFVVVLAGFVVVFSLFFFCLYFCELDIHANFDQSISSS